MSEDTHTTEQTTTELLEGSSNAIKTMEQSTKALLEASNEAINPQLIVDLLANKATIDSDGNIVVNGKTAKDAVSDLLRENPCLAKSSGSTGSGAAASNFPHHLPPIPMSLPPVDRINLARSRGIR